MSLFTSVLQHLKQKIDAGNAYKESIIEVCKDSIGITIKPDDIVSLKEGILTLRVSPTLKSLIILKQEKLVSAFQQKDIAVHTIR